MAVKSANYKGNLAASTIRGPSPSIWADCPIIAILEDPALGIYTFDEFDVVGNVDMTSAVAGSLGRWSIYGYAGAQIGDGQLEGGVMTYGSNGDNEGLAFMSSTGSYRITTTSTLLPNQKLWFECRIASSTVTADKHSDFVGLCTPSLSSGLPAAAMPISVTDDTLNTTPSLIGFHRKSHTTPNEWGFVYQLGGGTAVYPTGLQTLMNSITGAVLTAAGFVKLGFLFDPNAPLKTISSASTGQTAGDVRTPMITVFVNGMPAAAFLTSVNVLGAAFPTGFMGPCFANMNETASSPGTSSIDWIRVAQLANS